MDVSFYTLTFGSKGFSLKWYSNWKSTGAFIVFVSVYIHSVLSGKSDNVVDSTGWIALLSSLFMMFRSQITADMLSKLIENVSKKD